MKKLVKQTKQLIELRDLSRNNHNYNCTVASKGTYLYYQAKKLHALVYLDLGFVKRSDLTNQGLISLKSDPYQQHSEYFVVTEGIETDKPIAVARQINHLGKKGTHSFPLLAKMVINKSHQSQLDSYDPSEIVEISALVKAPTASSIAPLVLYKFMLDFSLQNRKHKIWLMALDINVYKKMKYHFGGVLIEIGDRIVLPGGDAIPLMLHTDRVFNLMENEVKRSRLMQKQTRKLLLSFFQADLAFEFEK